MSLSLKAELEAWASALNAYDEEDFAKALELFEPIADTSRILTNIGLILATVGEHDRAVENFRRATELDNYLAIAYFQGGVSSFLLSDYEGAFEQFENAFMWLRGNQAINYEQLGLNFRLYTAEILFNRGLCLINIGRREDGLADLQAARLEKATPEHDVIDDAIRDYGDGYTVFSIPVGILFRPNPNKIKNLQAKDYLGKARLISKDGTKYQTFDGVDPSELAFRPEERRKTPEGANLGRSTSDLGVVSAPRNPAGLSRAATTMAVTTAAAPSRPSPAPSSLDNARRPSLDTAMGRRPPVETLARANTTIRPMRPQSPPTKSRSPEPLTRANTSIRPGPGPGPSASRSPEPLALSRSRSPEPIGAGPARGMSVRRPALKATSPPVVETIYDSYASPPVRNEWNDRAPSRSGSRSQGSYPSRAPSQYTVRRAPSRKGTVKSRVGGSIGGGRVYEEEEGYVSGGGEEGDVPFELTKIRVRLHFNDSLRGMAIMPDISCDEFMDQVSAKFGKEYGDLVLKFADEDGARVTLMDESDFELAIETMRGASLKGKEPRLEIWCELA
ncbi:hypothetical protein FRC07_004955 [Ceratobasidium sp. 392]|nr:hypothetical protein FRC07_004955 [Ceratobasidium sp. 392]